ncbi:ammonium transporter [Cellulomonas carbonis]|uniref:Ammonium transporter n=1 Tax=Cellulomonas carbonis T26 TaxID=947969 RepID=A0A0A0BPJ8_9CELL|nr:ammonium transporter [Cellulomonas carbonis]KGM09880.1 ammonium transporter [Cellulomonas carbonis T26]MDT0166995.1 ammonium transporter [Actinotalea sp. AC32]GGB98016.1 ammonium transporter [Cellulomonas carbonis]
MEFSLDTGNTAWILTASALVLLMTPGLAFFYGGMVRGKSVLNMMMMSFGAMGVVSVIWVLWGYSGTFGSDIGGIIGNPLEYFGVSTITDEQSLMAAAGVPALVAVAFQATFAIITVALISGAVADRTKFGSWMVFTAVWVTLVYVPMAHMVWGGGLLGADGITSGLSTPIDFAGGTVVHINAGVAGLVLALVIGKRRGFGKEPMRPHNLPFVMLGAALLWFGWFGFNAGSEFAADGTAGRAWVNTLVATGVAMLTWLLTEKVRDGHATSLGAASGVVAGLVAITPAAAAVDTFGALGIGAVAGVLCALAVGLKYRFGYDDSLDVVGVHLVGGLVGTVLIGLFANVGDGVNGTWYPDGALNGLFYGGGVTQLATQVVVAVVAMVFSAAVTAVIAIAIKATIGLRASDEAELGGLDLAVHGEAAYETLGGGRFSGEGRTALTAAAPAARPTTEVK